MKLDNAAKSKEEAKDLAVQYHQKYGGCAQCTLGAVMVVLDSKNDEVFRSATGLSGGIGLTGSTCGALLGGVIALSYYKGRDFDDFEDKNEVRFISSRMARELISKFKEEYGSTNCKDIQTKLFGRSYDLNDEQDYKVFIEAGGHIDKCPYVCGNAAQWVVDIIAEENKIID